jgi:diaminopimelate decarboxylase
MKFNDKIIDQLLQYETPYYFYSKRILRGTLESLKKESEKFNYKIHYALKANSHPEILNEVASYGMGADCVSGNEVRRAVSCGFPPNQIVFAGVGKSDWEIQEALKARIFCFNCESIQEIQVINQLAAGMGMRAPIALRLNPNVNSYTHHYITTGLEENKFGIDPRELADVMACVEKCEYISLEGLHFHVGSQITDLNVFKNLCLRINEIHQWFADRLIQLSHINAGGGLGVNYSTPDTMLIPDFSSYFEIFHRFLELPKTMEIHFEPGRSVTGQCGSLISRVLYVKKGRNTSFAILDAGMTELIRPALYEAYHKIENLTSQETKHEPYDVVGPVCESSDCFGKAVDLPLTARGDLMAIRTAGAYGEMMASGYNLRNLFPAVFDEN